MAARSRVPPATAKFTHQFHQNWHSEDIVSKTLSLESCGHHTPCFGLQQVKPTHNSRAASLPIGGRIQNMSEVKEPCGKCGHPLSSHTRNVREEARSKAGIMSVDPALLPTKPYDIYSDKPAGESGCTQCPCPRWEPIGR